ncbi:MAG: transglycosylase SLT domain-containing protein [Rhodoferax sp.]|nr:transglycosylase SLT domain-containing protein [Rhodoferax sp.]MDP3650956.1 transglycosylase SLT domain-containing protein [Rhodoferax sp.]
MRSLLRWLIALCCLTGAVAHADVWVYVDDQGRTHLAPTQVEPGYVLFYKGASRWDALRTEPVPVALPVAVEMPPEIAKAIAHMEGAPGFKKQQHHVRSAADMHQVDYALLQALIATESRFDAGAVSPKGAIGLMQLMPATAARYGVAGDQKASLETKLKDPKTNIAAGTRYLRDLIRMFPGQLELALAAYNAGEGAVQKAGNKIPNFKETQNYVKTVMQLYTGLKPPVAAAAVAAPVLVPARAGRVRAELYGSTGRSNMVAPLAPIAGQSVAALD